MLKQLNGCELYAKPFKLAALECKQFTSIIQIRFAELNAGTTRYQTFLEEKYARNRNRKETSFDIRGTCVFITNIN